MDQKKQNKVRHLARQTSVKHEKGAVRNYIPCKRRTYSSEYPRPAFMPFVQTDPLVGHGLAEANLSKGQFLHTWKEKMFRLGNITAHMRTI